MSALPNRPDSWINGKQITPHPARHGIQGRHIRGSWLPLGAGGSWGELGVKEQSLRLTEEQIEADELEFHRLIRKCQNGDRGAVLPPESACLSLLGQENSAPSTCLSSLFRPPRTLSQRTRTKNPGV